MMLHFLNVIVKWAHSSKEGLKLRTSTESFHVFLLRISFNSYDKVVEFFDTMGYFVRQRIW